MLDGWFDVTPALLDAERRDLSAGELKAYFDGQQPQWRHALAAGQIPRRPAALEGLAHLATAEPGRPALVLLVGSEGTGKSTVLRQVACDLVAGGHRVCMRTPGARLDPGEAARPADDGPRILCSDDADEIAPEVLATLEQLLAAGRGDVHFLLAARDVEWKDRFVRDGRRLEPDWQRLASLWPTLHNRTQTLSVKAVAIEGSSGLAAWAASGTRGAAADATDIVGAWSAAGCLGAFQAVAPEDRNEALEERATKKLGVSDATLLGASLELRYGDAGLADLVEQALAGLGDPGLHRAFLLASAAEAAGVDGVDLLVVADLLGVDRDHRRETILVPLGQAGLATGSGGALRPRHRSLALSAISQLAAGRLTADLEEIYRDLVRGTATTGTKVKGLVVGGAIMSAGPLLAAKLEPLGVPTERAQQLAGAVAAEAEATLPDFLLFTVSRARTTKGAGHNEPARAILRAHLDDATTKQDWDSVGRAYLHELGACEATAGDLVSAAALAGLALADTEGLGPVTMADAKLALLVLGAACTGLAAADAPDEGARWRRQLRACTHLGEKVTPKWDQRARFDFHGFKVAADAYGIATTTAPEALAWLAETVEASMTGLHDSDLTALVDRLVPAGSSPGFGHLEHTIGLGRLPWAQE